MTEAELLAEIQKYKEALGALERVVAEKKAEVQNLTRYFNAARYVAHHTAFRYGLGVAKVDEMINRKYEDQQEENR